MPPLILNIETATQYCSVALFDGNRTLLEQSKEKNAHAEVITAMIEKLLIEADAIPSMLDAVAVSMGGRAPTPDYVLAYQRQKAYVMHWISH